MSYRQESIRILKQGLVDALPEWAEVSLEDDATNSRRIVVWFDDVSHSITMKQEIHQRVLREMMESDGAGWDAYGIHGMDAMLFTIAMGLEPQYRDKPHRIPASQSGLKLSAKGEAICRSLAGRFVRERNELLQTPNRT